MTLLTRKALLLAKNEAVYGAEETLDESVDSFIVQDCDFQADVTVLERNTYRASLSSVAHSIGRKLAKMRFTVELRSNGKTNSGSASDEALLGRLLRACAYSVTAVAAAEAGAVHAIGLHTNQVAWVDGGTLTNTGRHSYVIEVTTGGASGVAEVKITSDTDGTQTGVTVTSASAMTVGTKGLTLTPTFSGNLAVGQTWFVTLYPTGLRYTPVSTGFEGLTMKLFLDGVLHKMTGAMGTFTINAEAGQYATVTFDFTGVYYDPTDVTFPANPVYETTLPSQVENSLLRLGTYAAVVNAFTFDQANEIQIRPSVNDSNGYVGIMVTGRNPSGGVDPEAALVASEDFWGKLSAATRFPIQFRCGSVAGETIWFEGRSAQYTGLTYRDRNGLRVYDAALRFPGITGDDETEFFFM